MAIAVAAASCVIREAEPASRGVVVSAPPPAPLTDRRPPAPSQASVWVPGYWHWTGMHYAWIPGHWDSPPPGARWHAPSYAESGGHYTYEPGRWSAPQATPTAKALR